MKATDYSLFKILKYLFIATGVLAIFLIGRNEFFHSSQEINKRRKRSTNQVQSHYKIPNIVHYIWYNTGFKVKDIEFHHLLSMLSAYKIQKPEKIYVHTNKQPVGKYWTEAKNKIKSLIVNYRDVPKSLLGEKIKKPDFTTSYSDIDRVKIVHDYGGIYLDFDTFILSPLEPLRNHSCVIGEELRGKSCSCVFLCEKNSVFLKLWLNSYLDDFQVNVWNYNAGKVPWNLANRFPNLAYVEPEKLLTPNYRNLEEIFGNKLFNWRNQLTMHLYHRSATINHFIKEPFNEHNIKSMNSTFGEMARFIYYDTDKKL